MFWCLTMAIFRLYMTYLVSSYMRPIWAAYSGEVGVEVGTRSRMCHRGWVGWVHARTLLLYIMSELIYLGLQYLYYVCCRICTYILILYIYNLQYHTKYGFYSYSF